MKKPRRRLLLALAPVSQVIPIIIVAAERFLFIPRLGFALLADRASERARAAGRGGAAVIAVPVTHG